MINFLFLLILISCGPNSLEDFQKEGESFSRRLANELKEIQSRDELAKAAPHLKTRFNELVDLVIAAQTYADRHLDECLFDPTENPYSNELRLQLERLYRLEGGREMIEKAQKEALIRLDAFEKKCDLKKMGI